MRKATKIQGHNIRPTYPGILKTKLKKNETIRCEKTTETYKIEAYAFPAL